MMDVIQLLSNIPWNTMNKLSLISKKRNLRTGWLW